MTWHDMDDGDLERGVLETDDGLELVVTVSFGALGRVLAYPDHGDCERPRL